jgi:hypothetical protein
MLKPSTHANRASVLSSRVCRVSCADSITAWQSPRWWTRGPTAAVTERSQATQRDAIHRKIIERHAGHLSIQRGWRIGEGTYEGFG